MLQKYEEINILRIRKFRETAMYKVHILTSLSSSSVFGAKNSSGKHSNVSDQFLKCTFFIAVF